MALLIAALGHVVGHFMGPEAVKFMGAPPDVVQGARDKTILYHIMISGIIVLLSVLAILSWKRSKGRYARLFLWLFSGIFIIRGLLFLLFIPPMISGSLGPSPIKFWFHFLASLYVLSIGVALAIGLRKTRH